MTNKQVVERYRKAAMTLFGLTSAQAKEAIYSPEDDPGEWAPTAMAVINFETGCGLADHCGYYARYGGLDERFRWSEKAGFGFIEMINAAVGAVYD